MRQIAEWTAEERETLFAIAVKNSQVLYILGDTDVKSFYQKQLDDCKTLSENAKKVKEGMDKA